MKPGLSQRIIDYENGELYDYPDVVALFQDLVDTGLAWTLQGSYGRMAMHFIEAGEVTRPNEKRIISALAQEGQAL